MSREIEKLLRLTADYQHFCRQDPAQGNTSPQLLPDELGEDELMQVAAAVQSAMIRYDGKKPE